MIHEFFLGLTKSTACYAPASHYCTAITTNGCDVLAAFSSTVSAPTRLAPPTTGCILVPVTEFPRLLPFTHPISAYRQRDVERLGPVLECGVRCITRFLQKDRLFTANNDVNMCNLVGISTCPEARMALPQQQNPLKALTSML